MSESLASLLRKEKHSTETFQGRKKDLNRTFKDGRNNGRFQGLKKTYTPLDEGGEDVPGETKEVCTSVKKELDWFKEFFVPACNTMATKERSNQEAKGTLNLFGHKIVGLPVLALLNLETKLRDLKDILLQLPVLDDVKKWTPSNKTEGIFSAEPEWTYRSVPEYTNHVLHAGDEHHPAQVQTIKGSKSVGKYTTSSYSGAIPVGVKAEILKNVDLAIITVIATREEANLRKITDVKDDFSPIFDGILGPLSELLS